MTGRARQGTTSGEDSQPQTPPNDAIRRLSIEAESFLGAQDDWADIEAEINKIAESLGDLNELSEKERERLNELAALLEDQADGEALREALRRDGTLEVAIADDGMAATLRLQPPVGGGRPVTVDQVARALPEHHVKAGVDREAVAEAVAECQREGRPVERRIARGRGPTAGEDGGLVLYARRSMDEEPHAVAPDRPLEPYESLCKAGDTVLLVMPATAGQAGYDVLGNAIEPEPPASPHAEAGEHVKREGERFIAETDGVVRFDGEEVSVLRLLTVDGDVDRQTGPIKFDGQVLVRGNVRSGSLIAATGHVRIEGTVEGARIESPGDVDIRHGIVGQDRGFIRAGGSITARFAENATLYAIDTIDLQLGSIHSSLTAGRAIRLLRGQGRLTGGSAVAGQTLEAKQIGASSGALTEVRVGLNAKAMKTLAQLDHRAAVHEKQLNKARELCERMLRMVADPNQLPDRERKVFASLRKAELLACHKLNRVNEQRRELLDRSAHDRGGTIAAFRQVLPGTHVLIGSHSFKVDQARRASRFRYDEKLDRIVVDDVR